MLRVPEMSCFVVHVFGVSSFPCLSSIFYWSFLGSSGQPPSLALSSGVASVLGVGVRVGIGGGSGMPPTGHQSRAVFFLVASDRPFLAWGTPLEGRLLKLPLVISFQLLL